MALALYQNAAVQKIIAVYDYIVSQLAMYAAPVLDLAVRLWIARVFFNSGRVKIADWAATIYLFRDEYKWPPSWAPRSSWACRSSWRSDCSRVSRRCRLSV
jgi:hypothetical protein